MLDDIKKLRASLWESGYRPVAVYTKQKKPAGLKWTERARKDPPEAAVSPAYAYCASTGILCDGLRAIDIDIDDTDLADHAQEVAAEIFGIGPIRMRSGTGKRLILYRALEGSPAKKRVEGNGDYEGCSVEVLGHGRKFMAYGLHPEGMPYEWVDGVDLLLFKADRLETVSEDQVDRFLEIISSIIRIEEEKPPVLIRPAGPSVLSGSRLEKYAQSALQSILQKLGSCPKGGRNDLLNASSMRTGSMHARGWLAEAETKQALLGACARNGSLKEDGRKGCEATINSGWRAGLAHPAQDPVDNSDDDAQQITIGLTPKEAIKPAVVLPPALMDESLTHLPGILGELTDWICDSGPTGNRWLALSAALALTSMLLGRNIGTPTEGSLELYIIATYPSGGGKAHQEHAINSLVDKLKLDRHMADGEFKSGAYIEDLIQTKPLSLSIQDEFGQILNDMTAKNAPSYLTQMSAHLRKLYGKNFGIYRTGGARSRPSTTIHAPHLSLYGLSTNAQLFSAIKSKDISNGLINRFLLIDGGTKRTISPLKNRLSVKSPPPSLLRDLYRLYMIGSPSTGNMSGLFDKNTAPKPDIFFVPWEDDSAIDRYLEFQESCFDLIDSDDEVGQIYVRASFMAVKMATIQACCENPSNPKVSDKNMEWACALAKQSADRFYNEIKDNMVDTLGYSELFRKIESILVSNSEPGLPQNSIQRRKLWDRMKSYCGRNASDFSNCLKELEKNEVIVVHKMNKMTLVTLLPR